MAQVVPPQGGLVELSREGSSEQLKEKEHPSESFVLLFPF